MNAPPSQPGSPSHPPRWRPVDGGYDLWLLAESDVDEVVARLDAKSVLSASETERLHRLLRSDSRRRHLGARVLARWALGRYVADSPASVRFAVGQYGRPLLLNGGDLDFNLTHTDGLIACAVTSGAAIGVDVEVFPARPGATRLLSCVLTEHERSQLAGTDHVSIREALAEHWVLKEAYTKALGLGLHHPFDSFDIRNISTDPQIHDPSRAPHPLPDWSVHLLHLSREFVMGVARSERSGEGALPVRLFDAAATLAGVNAATTTLVSDAPIGSAVTGALSVRGQAEGRHHMCIEST